MLPFRVFIHIKLRSVHARPRPKPSATTKSVRSPRAEPRQTRVQPSRLIGERLSPLECAVEHPMKDANPEGESRPKDLNVQVSLLECAVTQNATLSALECAVAKTGLCKSFGMRTYKKRWGEGVSCSFPYLSTSLLRYVFTITLRQGRGRAPGPLCAL